MMIAVSSLFLFLIAAQFRVAAQNDAMATTTLKVGDAAPDFSLQSDQSKSVTLSDYRGKKNVVLAFYVLAFGGT
jgi:peroxiredoxin